MCTPARAFTSRGLITPEQLSMVAAATIDPMGLYRCEGVDRYRFEWIDPRCLVPLGLQPTDVVGRLFSDVVPSTKRTNLHHAANRAVSEGCAVRYVARHETDERVQHLEVTVTAITANGVTHVLTSMRDITDRAALDVQRDASDRRLRKLLEHAADMVWLLSSNGTILSATNAIEDLLGLHPDEVEGTSGFTLVSDDDRQYVASLLLVVLESTSDEPTHAEIPLRHRDGSTRWLECTLTNLLDDPDVGAIVVNSHDVTERKLVEERLAHAAMHDDLTGLPNRALVAQRITAMLDDASGTDHLAAVLFVDFDGFKLINDTLGHDLGDEMIRAAARRLEETVGSRGWVARLGGDEFIVVAADLAPVERHRALADQLRSALVRPFLLNGSPIYLTASMGLATGSASRGDNADEMLRRADMAMYEAKRRGHNSIQLFDESLRQLSEHRLETRNLLRAALGRRELHLLYQPIFSNETRTVTGVEALLRWHHPIRGMVAPGDFIDIAEETGLIVPIGEWVLDEVCRQLALWDRRGYARIQAAVNVSPKQLLDPDFVAKVRASVSRAGIDPAGLIIEITENLIMEDPEASRRVLEELARLGVGCAIDDFGMGYSSLSYLAKLPATILKIDRTFVAPLAGASAGAHDLDHGTALVSAIIGMAHALGLAVVAEGVETELQLVELRRLGCEFAQGFHLARPSAAEQVEALLRRRATSNVLR